MLLGEKFQLYNNTMCLSVALNVIGQKTIVWVTVPG